MKYVWLILFTILYSSFTFSQNKESYDAVKDRVSKSFFKTPEKAKKDSYKLEKLAKTNDEKQVAYKFLGYVYDLTGKVDSARFYLNKRLNFTKKHFYKQLPYYEAVISYSNWGVDYIDSKVLIEKLTDALTSIKYGEFQEQKGLMYMLMGDILLRENDLDNANTYFDKSFKLITSKYAPIDYYLRKGKIAILENNYIDAEIFLNKGLNVLEAKTTYTYPSFLNLLGYISLMRGKIDKANSYLNESLDYQEKNNFKTFRAKTYLYLSYIAKENNSNKEKEYLDKSLEYSLKDPVVTKDIYLAYKGYFERNKQFNQEQVYLRKFNQLNDSIFNTEKAKIKLDLEWRYKLTESKKEIEYKEQIIHNDKQIKKLYAFALILLALLIVTLIIMFLIKTRANNESQNTQKLLHEVQLKSTLENQKIEIIKEKIKAISQERERLSLELHDGIANDISSLKLFFYNEKTINSPLIETTVDKIDKLYNEVRNLSHDLNPDSITEIEFSQLVDKICVMAEKSGIMISKQILISKHIDDLDETILLNLYRIIQELINNIIKHSKATKATVEIIETDSKLLIQVFDNGVGIETSKKTGIGLKNINKRVQYLKGTIDISGLSGTTIKIQVPI